MKSRITRWSMILVATLALIPIGTLLTRNADAQSSAVTSAVLVAVAPLPRDLLHIEAKSGPLSTGQSFAIYTVPTSQNLVIMNAYIRDIPHTGGASNSSSYTEEVSLINTSTNQVLLTGLSFVGNSAVNSNSFFVDGVATYNPTHGLFVPAGTQLALQWISNPARQTNVANKVNLQFAFDGYLTR